MVVDKNVFPYELSVVIITKDEAPYLKEWLDYHLLAGVDHFYFYDWSTDNTREILQPYINAGIVTYFFYPGRAAQSAAYDDAIKKFRFHSRYMAFIDADEFIFPQDNRGIVEVVDELLAEKPYASGLALNWHFFGSSHQEKADYGRDVIERFVYRAANDNFGLNRNIPLNSGIKNIVNPRKIAFFSSAHNMWYFDGNYTVNEEGGIVLQSFNMPVTDKKIVLNHYHTKSREEYIKRANRGAADGLDHYDQDKFNEHDQNDIFDDRIIEYRNARIKALLPQNGGG